MLKENDRISGGNIFEGIVSVRTLIANSLAFAAGNSGNDRKIKRVFCDSGRTGKSREYAWIKHRGEELGFDVVMCSSEDIDCMTVGNTHGGLAAECTGRTIPGISADMIKPNGFYVMLEGIEDPYNFGYALRSLYAAGADGIILTERNWMTAAGIVCRASAGASELIPLCHILNLSKLEVEFIFNDNTFEIETRCTAKTTGKTGVEMEALTGVNVALLTIYDMCKAVDKGMEINEVHLLRKSGGKSGVWERQ